MKTLNEVIKAHEICVQNLDCIDCPYCDEPADSPKWGCALCGECPKDALFYLKKYRNSEPTQKEEKPLSWEELQQMNEKPVWIEKTNGDIVGWALIINVQRDSITCTIRYGNLLYLDKINYNEKWKIYNKLCNTETSAVEKTAKVVSMEHKIKGSDDTISVTSCSNCENVVSIFDDYCPNCGYKLIWK